MATVTNVENESQFEPQVVYVVSVDDDAAVANMERDSLEIELNEESTEFETHSSRNIITSATTTDPALSFTLARGDDAAALDTLGIRDSAQDGLHVRGADREKARMELWYYPDDADPSVDSPNLVDAFEDCRVDAETVSTETNAGLIEVTIDVNGDVYWDTTSDLAA